MRGDPPTLNVWLTCAVMTLPAVLAQAATPVAQAPARVVVALDAANGHVVWRARPGPMEPPRLTVDGDVLLVHDGTHPYFLNAAHGEVLAGPPPCTQDGGCPTGAPIHSNTEPGDNPPVEDAPGAAHLIYKKGYTRNLCLQPAQGPPVLVRKLPDFPANLVVHQGVAVFTFAGGGSTADLGGGDVYAVNLKSGLLQWEYHAWRQQPTLADHTLTEVYADDDGVVVFTDQMVTALRWDGRPLWTKKLPRQKLRPFDSAWTTAVSHQGMLLLVVYERMFALNRRTGRLAWAWSFGPHTAPSFETGSVLASGNRVFAVTRVGALTGPTGGVPQRTVPPQSVIAVEKQKSDRFTLRLMARRQVPKGAKVWSPLAGPPVPSGDEHIILDQGSADEEQLSQAEQLCGDAVGVVEAVPGAANAPINAMDLTQPLLGQPAVRTVYVQRNQWPGIIRLVRQGTALATVKVRKPKTGSKQ